MASQFGWKVKQFYHLMVGIAEKPGGKKELAEYLRFVS